MNGTQSSTLAPPQGVFGVGRVGGRSPRPAPTRGRVPGALNKAARALVAASFLLACTAPWARAASSNPLVVNSGVLLKITPTYTLPAGTLVELEGSGTGAPSALGFSTNSSFQDGVTAVGTGTSILSTLGNAVTLAAGVSWSAGQGASTLEFGGGGTMTVDNGMTLGAGLMVVASSNVVLGASPLSAQGTAQIDGTLDLSATTSASTVASLSGASTGVLNLGSSGVLDISNASTSYAGSIEGTGGSVNVLGGTQALSGSNTYTGATTIASGATLALTGSATLSSSPIADDGTLDISGATTQVNVLNVTGTGNLALGAGTLAITQASGTLGGAISGSGNLFIQGASTLSLGGQSGFTGIIEPFAGATLSLVGTASLSKASVVLAGNLDISPTLSGASVGSISGIGNVTLGSQTLTITAGNGISLAGVISGAGGVHVTGGVQDFYSIQTYTGTTIIDSGAGIELSGMGELASPLVDNGTLSFVNDTETYRLPIEGSGNVDVQAGTATLSAPSTYSGTTLIESGATLALTGAGSLPDSAVSDNGTLDISSSSYGVSLASLGGSGQVSLGNNTLSLTNAAGTMSGTIVGAGALSLLAGQEILSGTQSYQGGTTIQGGTLGLSAGASLASAVLVQSAGTLQSDSATIGGALDNQGIVAVGSSTHAGAVLSVDGAYTQAASGVLRLSLAPGSNGQLVVHGSSVNLNGTLQVVATPGSYQKNQYILVQAPSTTTLSGTFSQVQLVGLGSLYGYQLTYLNDPQVLLSLFPQGNFTANAHTPNTVGPANALTGAIASATGTLYSGLDNLNNLPPQQLARALDQMDGQMYAQSPGWLLHDVNWSWQQVFSRMNLSQQLDPHGVHSLFLIGGARATHLLGDGNADSTREGAQSFTLGDQGRRGPWHMGALAGVLHLGAIRSGAGDSLSATLWHGGAFAFRDLGPVRLGTVLGYSQGPVQTIGASREAYVLSSQTRVGRTLRVPGRNLSITPLLGLNLQYLALQSVSEANSQLGLSVPSQCQYASSALAAVRLDKRWERGGVHWTFSAGLGVRHAIKEPIDHVSLQFNGIPGSSFTTYGVAPDRNVYQGTLGLHARVGRHLRVGVAYEGSTGQSYRGNAFTLRAVWHF